MGNMKVKLFNATPVHRDNFIKLVKEGYYEGILFHRVIDQFMIQAGDPESIEADSGVALGNGGPGYTLKAEFNDSLLHVRGALAAARKGDNQNPEKRSSGSQFYIVDGKTFRKEDVNRLLLQKNGKLKQELFNAFISDPENAAYKEKLMKFQKEGNQQGFQTLLKELNPIISQQMDTLPKYSYSEEQITRYEELGGAPHLDGDYTVFGILVEGFETLDRISSVATDPRNRPLSDVVIEKMKIVRK